MYGRADHITHTACFLFGDPSRLFYLSTYRIQWLHRSGVNEARGVHLSCRCGSDPIRSDVKMWSLCSSGSAADECDRRGDFSDGDSGVVAAAAGGACERKNRVLQAALRGVWKGGFWGQCGETEPDVVCAGRAAPLDRVPHMGAGRHQRWRRARLLPSHHSHARRWYVSQPIERLTTCNLNEKLNFM